MPLPPELTGYVADDHYHCAVCHETHHYILSRRQCGIDVNAQIEHPCLVCNGDGTRLYGSSRTWRKNGGLALQAFHRDVCDECWGSGDADRPWPSWRDRHDTNPLRRLFR
jgi:hypothetical protein